MKECLQVFRCLIYNMIKTSNLKILAGETMNLNGKTCIVTGSSRGIGREIAIEMAKHGANIIINYFSDESGALETLKSIKEIGGFAEIIKADVSDYASAKYLIDESVKRFGKLDILVNNAGISKIGLIIDMKEEDFDKIITTNLKSVFNCTKHALPYMINKKNGNIINISSMWGQKGASCEAIYSASKGGVNSFTKALAKELGPSNIRVNAIAPGVINTDMNSWLSEAEKKELEEEIPLIHFGEGKDIGKMAVFLASDDSQYITGQIINVDGGI